MNENLSTYLFMYKHSQLRRDSKISKRHIDIPRIKKQVNKGKIIRRQKVIFQTKCLLPSSPMRCTTKNDSTTASSLLLIAIHCFHFIHLTNTGGLTNFTGRWFPIFVVITQNHQNLQKRGEGGREGKVRESYTASWQSCVLWSPIDILLKACDILYNFSSSWQQQHPSVLLS